MQEKHGQEAKQDVQNAPPGQNGQMTAQDAPEPMVEVYDFIKGFVQVEWSGKSRDEVAGVAEFHVLFRVKFGFPLNSCSDFMKAITMILLVIKISFAQLAGRLDFFVGNENGTQNELDAIRWGYRRGNPLRLPFPVAVNTPTQFFQNRIDGVTARGITTQGYPYSSRTHTLRKLVGLP
jgi:hypothetical protein